MFRLLLSHLLERHIWSQTCVVYDRSWSPPFSLARQKVGLSSWYEFSSSPLCKVWINCFMMVWLMKLIFRFPSHCWHPCCFRRWSVESCHFWADRIFDLTHWMGFDTHSLIDRQLDHVESIIFLIHWINVKSILNLYEHHCMLVGLRRV